MEEMDVLGYTGVPKKTSLERGGGCKKITLARGDPYFFMKLHIAYLTCKDGFQSIYNNA